MVDTVNDSLPADNSFEYEVIGEHFVDPMHLLTIDAEGRLFDLNLESGRADPTELSDCWVVDTVDAKLYLRRAIGLLPPPTLVVG